MDYNKLFENEKKNPSAWNFVNGTHSAHIFDSIIFGRDEKEIVKASKQHGFRMYRVGKHVLFTI